MPKCVLERVCECARKSDQYLPISGAGNMNAENEIVCGADIHRAFPKEHWKKIITTNRLERINEEWLTGRKYLSMIEE
jgi:hypothetical protein